MFFIVLTCEHAEEHAEEQHGRVVVDLAGLVANVPVQHAQQEPDEHV